MNSNVARAVLSLLFLACVVASACGSNDHCTTVADCFSGEVCSSGLCVDASAPNNATTGGGGGTIKTKGPGQTTSNGTTGGGNNGGNNNGGTTNNGSTSTGGHTSDPRTGVCTSDPFTAQCSASGDGFYTYLTTDTGRGCHGGDDDFEGGTYEHETIELCPMELQHKYNTNLISCRTRSFFVEVVVTPLQPCDRDDWDLNVRVQGLDCGNPEDGVRCELHEDGVSKRVTARVVPEQSITIPYIDITPLIADMHFEYDLTVTVRE